MSVSALARSSSVAMNGVKAATRHAAIDAARREYHYSRRQPSPSHPLAP